MAKKEKERVKDEAIPVIPKADKSADSLFRVIIGNHYHLSQMADNKAHIMITICAAILGFGVKELFDPQLMYATAALLICCLGSLFLAVYSTMPKSGPLQKPDPKDPNFNVIFFSYFMHLPAEEFDRQMEALICDQRKIHQSMVKDLYGHGQVLGNKYRYLRYCYLTFLAGVILSVLVFALTSAILPSRRDSDSRSENTTSEQKNRPHVLIIRHAEKPPDAAESVHLSARGVERAAALPALFTQTARRPAPFPTPDFIFAAKNSRESHRSVETVTPLAKHLNIPINTQYANEDYPKMVEELFRNPKYADKTVLICWHHGTTPALAKKLKATDAPDSWKGSVFDRVWEITYDEDGKAALRSRPQQLLDTDTEK